MSLGSGEMSLVWRVICVLWIRLDLPPGGIGVLGIRPDLSPGGEVSLV